MSVIGTLAIPTQTREAGGATTSISRKKEDDQKLGMRNDSEDHKRWERPTERKESVADQKNRLAKYFDEEKGAMCFNCREWGHIVSNCPKRVLRVQTLQAPADYLVQGKVDGVNRNSIKLDSGAQHTLVHRDVVKQTAYTSKLKVAGGDVIELPLAEVTFQFAEERRGRLQDRAEN